MFVVGLLVGPGAWGTAAWAQQERPSLQLDLAVSQPVPPFVPSPAPEVVQRDTDEAIARITARQKEDELVRDTVRRPDPRPDLRYDIVNGIQSRNIQDALRRR